MMETYCIPCVYGQHDEHIEMIEVPMPGVMGGARCPCKGECVSRKGEAMSAGEDREMPSLVLVDPAEHAKVVDELHHREREFAEVCANEDRLDAELARARARIEELEREKERMYQRALDAESHAAFGPMDVDERVRLLRNLVDVTEREKKAAEARIEELEAEVERLKDESRVGWLERALDREQNLRRDAEERMSDDGAEKGTCLFVDYRCLHCNVEGGLPPVDHVGSLVCSRCGFIITRQPADTEETSG